MRYSKVKYRLASEKLSRDHHWKVLRLNKRQYARGSLIKVTMKRSSQ